MSSNPTDQALAAMLTSIAKKYQPKIKQSGDKIIVTTFDGKSYTLQFKTATTTRSQNIRNR